MAGMARRGAHSARHRVGSSRPDAAGPAAQDGTAPDAFVPPGVAPEVFGQPLVSPGPFAPLDRPDAGQTEADPAALRRYGPDQGHASSVRRTPEGTNAGPPASSEQAAPMDVRPDARSEDAQRPDDLWRDDQRPEDLLAASAGPAGLTSDVTLPDGLSVARASPPGMAPDVTRPDNLRPGFARSPDRAAGERLNGWPGSTRPAASPPRVVTPAGSAPAPVRPVAPPAQVAPPAGTAPGPAAPPARPATPKASPRRGRSRSGAIRVISALTAAGVVIIAGLSGAVKSEPSVTASVKNFLFAWQSADYATAAAMTTGNHAVVASSLQAAYSQLGAEDLQFTMGPISVHGSSAHAYFYASIDLGRGGQPWNYRGSIRLRQVGSQWLVVWSPSVIVPGLGPKDRLAVLTTMPPRRSLLDAAGRPLILQSPVVEVGVVPAHVTNAKLTSRELAHATGLAASDADEMRGQILAAPPDSFLELVQMSPGQYARLRGALRKIPHLAHRRKSERLFKSTVPEVTGRVGTETAKVLVQEGDPYLPGTTVGLTGLQQAFQSDLVGTPTTQVVVQDSAGKQVKVLKTWQGKPGTPVRTTIDGRIEQAARRAVDGSVVPAAIVAVQARTGRILAVASHHAAGLPAVNPLNGQYQPGQAFTIVSTAALLAARPDFGPSSQEPCYPGFSVNGQTFANVPPEPRLGKHPPLFSADFANACSTAFAELSLNLSPVGLAAAATEFGIGARWQLPIAAFVGSMAKPSSSNSPALPADVTGMGTVQVSPLDMALAAGVVAAGSWHQPSLVTAASGPAARPSAKVPAQVIAELRELMGDTVRLGAARSAKVAGSPLFGQVGSALLAGHPGVRAIWFVGYRSGVAFAVLAFSRSAAFDSALTITHQFAAALGSGS